MNLLRQLFYKNRRFYDDDFDWNNYTADSYHRRLKTDVEPAYQAIAAPGEVQFDPDSGQVRTGARPVHPNHALILEAVGRLAPASVHEVGCGGGDHVAAVRALFPDLRVTGGDRGETQLALALERHPELAGGLGVQDITMPLSSAWPRAELIYTQAVVMHIHTAVSHFVALSNMVALAGRYVLLVENQQCHNLVADTRALFDGGHLAWDALHLYRFEGSTGARALLLSNQTLDLPEAADDTAMRAGLAPSARRLKRADEDSARALFGFARR